MGYGIEATTADCYPGTSCLINKLGIQDETKLAETEAAVVLGKASFLDQQPVTGEFDFTHYRSIHHFLFCDLYDWAGRYARSTFLRKERYLSLPPRSKLARMRVLPDWLPSPARDALIRKSLRKLRIFTAPSICFIRSERGTEGPSGSFSPSGSDT